MAAMWQMSRLFQCLLHCCNCAGECGRVCGVGVPGTRQADQRGTDARGTPLWLLHETEAANVGAAGWHQYITGRRGAVIASIEYNTLHYTEVIYSLLLFLRLAGLHHYECVAPLVANSLQSCRFWARSTASVHDSPWESRSFCTVFIQVICYSGLSKNC